MNYKDLLAVDTNYNNPYTRTTKCVKTDYGYRIQRFNSYVTLYYIKLIVNPNGSAKAHYKEERNYCPVQRYTVYFDCDGNECTQKEYKVLN